MSRGRSRSVERASRLLALFVAVLSNSHTSDSSPTRRGGPPPIRAGAASGAGGASSGGLLSGVAASGLGKVAIVAAAGVVVVGSVGAGVVLLTSGDSADLSKVPEDVDTIQYTDVDTLRKDKAITSVVDKLLALAQENGATEETPEDYEGLKEKFDEETGLELEKLHAITTFSKYNDEGEGISEYSGTIIDSNWKAEDLVSAIEEDSGITLVEAEENGVTVYKPEADPEFGEGQWIAVLGGGQFALGTPDAVSDVIDVENGEMDAVSGELKTAFKNTRGGYVKFAGRIPQEAIPAEHLGQGSSLDTSAFNNVVLISGAYYTDGDKLGTELKMHASSEDHAKDILDVTEGSVQLARGAIDIDEVKDTLRNVEVSRDGTVVKISYESSVENITAVLDAVNEETVQSERGDEIETNIQAGASVSVDAETNEIETVWTSNQNAEFMRVEYEVVSGSGQDEVARLSDVGDNHLYEGADGQTVRVTVRAVAGDQSTLIVEREVEL